MAAHFVVPYTAPVLPDPQEAADRAARTAQLDRMAARDAAWRAWLASPDGQVWQREEELVAYAKLRGNRA